VHLRLQLPPSSGSGLSRSPSPSSSGRSRLLRHPVRQPVRRLLLGLGLLLLLAALITRIACTEQALSDGSNTILEGWDFAHGNVLLHGWILSDVSFYALEIPVAALSVLAVGASAMAVHLTAGLVFTLVIGCTLWCDRGPVTRWVLALAVLLVPLSDAIAQHALIVGVDHLGSSVFILLSTLVVDRLRGRWFAPWLLLLVLTLGEVSDEFVAYVGVPAVVGVCFWEMASERRLSWDVVDLLRLAAAATVSVTVARHVRSVLRHLGAYAMTAPNTVVSPRSEWLGHLSSTWFGLRVLLGFAQPGGGIAGVREFVLGWMLLALVVLGAIRTLCHWRTSPTAQRISVLLVPGALAAYTLSEQSAKEGNAFDLAGAMPFCALLAANALPGRWSVRCGLRRAAVGMVGAVTALAVLFAAAQPAVAADSSMLIARLRALHLSYGISDYPTASSTTVQSDLRVTVRAVVWNGAGFDVYGWETRTPWYDAAKHDARFFVTSASGGGTTPTEVVAAFGRPEAQYRVGHDEVLVYSYNLLTRIRAAARPTG